MNPVNILHISDIHLDSKICGLSADKSAARRTEIQLTLKRILEKFSEAEIVLIAGDIFDGAYNKSTIKYLCKLFSEYPEKKFFAVCGNHDYLSCRPMADFIEEKPKNTVIFGENISCVTLDELSVRIYGASFSSPNLYSSLLSGFKASDDGYVNIMLMHGEIDSGEKYNPISVDDIAKSGLDYLALGHTHSFSGIKKAGKTYYAYSGIPEPRGFDECGECGVIYGKISKDFCDLKFYPISKRKYELLYIDITDCFSDADVVNKINSVAVKNNIYRITLNGVRSESYIPNLANISEFVNAFYCELADSSKSRVNIFEFANENSLRGRVAAELLEASQNGGYDGELLNDAAEILNGLFFRDGADI